MTVTDELVLTMTHETRLAWIGGLLLGASLALPSGSPHAAQPQGWNAELVKVSDPSPAPGRKKIRAAAARAAAKAERQKPAAPVDAEFAAPGIATPLAPAAAKPAEVAATPESIEEEPADPFNAIRLERSADGEALTTQVVPAEPNRTPGGAPPPGSSAVSQYCSSIVDAAIDARIAWQRQNLADVEKQVAQRTADLEAKTAEYQKWLARRDEFAEKAKKTVVDIYTKMKPDAAALQLQALDEETAAAVIIKLDPRTASAVMNEMDPAQAARLTAIISGAAKGPGRPRPPQGNRS
jgi:flagellar motility protein MotE (MotC chaperone)